MAFTSIESKQKKNYFRSSFTNLLHTTQLNRNEFSEKYQTLFFWLSLIWVDFRDSPFLNKPPLKIALQMEENILANSDVRVRMT